MKLILASSSSKRREILEQLEINFQVEPSRVEELIEHDSAIELAQANSVLKVKDVAERFPEEIILAADTVVVLKQGVEEILCLKPRNQTEALKMFEGYFNSCYGEKEERRVNQVITGMSLYCPMNRDGKATSQPIKTEFEWSEFKPYDYPLSVKKDLFQSVIDLDKSGGFSIEGRGAILFDCIKGSYYNILGLPVHQLTTLLASFGYSIFDFVRNPAGERGFKAE